MTPDQACAIREDEALVADMRRGRFSPPDWVKGILLAQLLVVLILLENDAIDLFRGGSFAYTHTATVVGELFGGVQPRHRLPMGSTLWLLWQDGMLVAPFGALLGALASSFVRLRALALWTATFGLAAIAPAAIFLVFGGHDSDLADYMRFLAETFPWLALPAAIATALLAHWTRPLSASS